jgi:hypothetical protein
VQIAGLATFATVIGTVPAESDIVLALAEDAILLADAARFLQIALRADKTGSHMLTVLAGGTKAKVTKVR